MSKQSDFFIYLIERYAEAKNNNAQNILRQWDSLDLTNLIYEMYELYHVERLENAFNDIDALILERTGSHDRAE
jgi:acyl carrier protein